MKKQTHRHKQSFTLIELLVVIAIIAILAAVIVANVTSAQTQARDARRAQDLDQLRTALEMYYLNNGSYPYGNIGPNSISSRLGFCIEAATGFKTSLTGGDYVYSLPQDPLYNSSQCDSPYNADCHCYIYKTDTDQKYKLFAKVEQQDFKPAKQDGGTEVTLYEVYAPILGANQIAYVAYGSGYAEPGGIPIVFAGTENNVAKFTSPTELGDSIIYDNGTNIGIGTTNPGAKLDVAGTIRTSGGYGISYNNIYKTYEKTYLVNTATPATLVDDTGSAFVPTKSYKVKGLVTGTSTQTGAVAYFYGDGTNFNLYKEYESGTSSNHVEFYLDSGVPKVRLYGHGSLYSVSVLTEEYANKGRVEGPQMFMYANGNGNVGIGTTSPNRKLKVNGDAGGTTAWYNDSDARLKTNVQTIPNALEKVEKMRGVSFAWIDTENHPKGQQIGFIAQELKDVLPEVVDKKGEYYSVQESSITAVLVEAIKEQQKQIEDLKAQIEILKNR